MFLAWNCVSFSKKEGFEAMTSVFSASVFKEYQSFTEKNAHLGARDFLSAKLEFDEQQSAEALASGEATETFKMKLEDRVFTIAGTKLEIDMSKVSRMDGAAAEVAVAGEAAGTEDVQRYLLNLQEEAPAEAKSYDFTNMTRGEIADAGKELFAAGKISLDELFRFEHPDGKLKIDTDGTTVELDPTERIDFVAEVEKALQNMEETGEANQPKSGYTLMQGLLDKLLLMA
jgi:hypothetical protein